jgi:hypothetical protein
VRVISQQRPPENPFRGEGRLLHAESGRRPVIAAGLRVVKSRAEMMERVGTANMPNSSAAAPICPKAICWTCRKKNWRSSSPNFSATGRLKRTILIQRRRGSAPHRLGWYSPGKHSFTGVGRSQAAARSERSASTKRHCIDQVAQTRRRPDFRAARSSRSAPAATRGHCSRSDRLRQASGPPALDSKVAVHCRHLVPAVAQDFSLDLEQIGLDGDDPAQPPQQ